MARALELTVFRTRSLRCPRGRSVCIKNRIFLSFFSLWKLSLRQILMNFDLGQFAFFLLVFLLYVYSLLQRLVVVESNWSEEHLKALLCFKHQLFLVEVRISVTHWCLECRISGSLICRVYPMNFTLFFFGNSGEITWDKLELMLSTWRDQN